MRASILLLPLFAGLMASASAQPVAEGLTASFQSIELRGGMGKVTVQYGPTHRVTVRGPGGRQRPIRVENGQLVIERCPSACPDGHRIELDIVTPSLSRIAVADGGLIEVSGQFPPQDDLAASVSSGGMIDIRSLRAARVAATVDNGGRILASPGRELTASVSDGGNVTYWGEASVRSSIRRGGVVERGDAADLSRPAAELGALHPPPPRPVHRIAAPKPPRRPSSY